MTDILNNPWFVGIGGGVLSGLFVAIITRALFSRRDKREYIQKLNIANAEILYAIRPGVSEGVIPHQNVVGSLIKATARKYRVDVKDMYDITDLADGLIKEVMDSSFISASAKNEFCEKLTFLKSDSVERTVERPESIHEYEAMSKYRKQTVAILSMMVGLLTAVMGIVATLQANTGKFEEKLIFLMMPALISVVAAYAVRILKDLKPQAIKVRFLGTEISFKEKKEATEQTNSTNTKNRMTN